MSNGSQHKSIIYRLTKVEIIQAVNKLLRQSQAKKILSLKLTLGYLVA